MNDFARIITTPKYGDVVVIDDVGDITPKDPGHVRLYLGGSGGVTVLDLPRAAYDVITPFIAADPDPSEIQSTLDLLDRRVAGGKIAMVTSTNKGERKSIGKLFHSEKYGQVVAVLNGDMEKNDPHIMVQFRPTRPTTIRAISLICPSRDQPDVITKALPTPDEFAAGLNYMIELRFEQLELAQIETCIEGWINNYPANRVPPITFT